MEEFEGINKNPTCPIKYLWGSVCVYQRSFLTSLAATLLY